MTACVWVAGFTLASVLKNPPVFQQFLVRNLSLSNSSSSLLLNAPVSLREVRHRRRTHTGMLGDTKNTESTQRQIRRSKVKADSEKASFNLTV